MKQDQPLEDSVSTDMPLPLVIGSLLRGWGSTRSKLIDVANKCDDIAKRNKHTELAELAIELRKTTLVLVSIGQLLSTFHRYLPLPMEEQKLSFKQRIVAAVTILLRG